jgi:hypothetical protein
MTEGVWGKGAEQSGCTSEGGIDRRLGKNCVLGSLMICTVHQMLLLVVVIRARSQDSGCTAAIRLIVHPVF